MIRKKSFSFGDFSVHPAHQYCLAKLGHSFFFLRENLTYDWRVNTRPQPYNCYFINIANPNDFDLIITHNSRQVRQVENWKESGILTKDIPLIYIFHFQPSGGDDEKEGMASKLEGYHLVFNSYDSQKSWGMPNESQRTIIHGFDQDEWRKWKGGINGVLTVAGRMGDRPHVTGYPFWKDVVTSLECEKLVMGSKWDKMMKWEKGIVRHSKNWDDLKKTMANYDVYFSPTHESPFPRARSEAFVTGMPMVTTPDHNVNLYVEHSINGFITDDAEEAVYYINLLLADKDLRKRFSKNAREKAREVLNIDRFLKEWNDLLDFIMG